MKSIQVWLALIVLNQCLFLQDQFDSIESVLVSSRSRISFILCSLDSRIILPHLQKYSSSTADWRSTEIILSREIKTSRSDKLARNSFELTHLWSWTLHTLLIHSYVGDTKVWYKMHYSISFGLQTTEIFSMACTEFLPPINQPQDWWYYYIRHISLNECIFVWLCVIITPNRFIDSLEKT